MSKPGMQPPGGVDPQALEAAELVAPGLIHELRQPLLGLKVGLQLVARQHAAVATLPEWSTVGDQLTRIEEILRGFQEFLDPGGQSASDVDLERVVRRALKLLHFRLEPLGRRFAAVYEADLPPVRTASHAVTHALTNLLVNALDALAEEAPDARLAVRVMRSPTSPNRLEVRVSDEGSGIPAAVRARIFEARFTTKPAGKGTGLGLAIAQQMMGAAGGEVRLAADDDPARLPWARTEFAIAVPVAGAPQEPQPRRPTALVVEDEEVLRGLLEKLLTLKGFDVRGASTTAGALAELAEASFDLVLTDKNLPGEGGVRVAHVARARNSAAALVLVTGYASRESAEALLASEVDEYLQKPFDPTALLERLDELLARRRALVTARERSAGAPLRRTLRVGLWLTDASTRAAVEDALGELGARVVQSDALSELEDVAPMLDGLVIEAASCTEEVQRAVWKLRIEAPQLKVLVVSAGRTVDAALDALRCGASAYLSRPLPAAAALAETLARTFGAGACERRRLGGDSADEGPRAGGEP